MKKILAFAGSNSKQSINKTLASYAANLVEQAEVQLVDLNDYELPIYSIDLEKENGMPQSATQFSTLIASADGIVLSLAEHNGNFSAAFKNLIDWLSRIEGKKVWQNKPMLLLATSPGARGASSVLGIAKTSFPYLGGQVAASFSLPAYYDNFVNGAINNNELKQALVQQVNTFAQAL